MIASSFFMHFPLQWKNWISLGWRKSAPSPGETRDATVMHGRPRQANKNFASIQYKFSVGVSNKATLQSPPKRRVMSSFVADQSRRAKRNPGKTLGGYKVRVSSKCYSSILIGSMLALPAIGQQTNANQQSTG